MAGLKEKIYADLQDALRKKEQIRLNALRMLKTAITYFEVEGEKKEAEDEDVIALAKREIKKRKEAAELYLKGNRPELAEKEEAEIKFLEVYLPEQLGEEEIKKVIKATMAELQATSKADFGKVMGAVMGKLKGEAEGSVVSRILGSLLK